MSAGEDHTPFALCPADLDCPSIPLEERAARGAALAGWRRRLEPDLEWIAARGRMHPGHNGGIGADALVWHAVAGRR